MSATTTESRADVTRNGVRRVLWTTLALNLAVSGGKIVVGTLAGSLAVVADGYHSLVDGSNNVLGLIVAAYAFAPPDRGHPYGHRKFETAAALFIGVALLLLAWELMVHALGQAGRPSAPDVGPATWAMMIATLAMNAFVTRYEAREGRRLGSAFLLADAAHTRSDLFVSLGVLGSLAATATGIAWADSVMAGLVAAVVGVQAALILVHSVNVLTDRVALPPEAIERVAVAVAGVHSVQSVRTRGGSGAVFVDLTVRAAGDLSLRAAHEVADRIEEALVRAHPEIVDVVVHLEPV
jgi:cation diffusion facilitator family transporter